MSDARDEEAFPRSQSGIKQIEVNVIIKLDESQRLNDTNWVDWNLRMISIFRLCQVRGYVKGTILCPDPNVDPEGAKNWSYNDAFSQVLISENVTKSQRNNFSMCDNAHEMWANLEIDNSSQASKTLFACRRKLFHTTAGERDNIVEHLDKLNKYRLESNSAALYDERLEVSDDYFNLIIAQSLPPSWDYFTGSYVVTRMGADIGTMISSQQFIDVIKQEYWRREQCDREYLSKHITMYVGQ